MGQGCSSGSSVRTPTRVSVGPTRGPSYDPAIDYRVRQLAAEIGEEVLIAVCYEFYCRVEAENSSFTEVFSTPARESSELLCFFLLEAWGSDRHMYSEHRGAHFAFLYATHRVWSFHLTEDYWQKWQSTFLAAAEHYYKLQQQSKVDGQAVVLTRAPITTLASKLVKKCPKETRHDKHTVDPTDDTWKGCPFAKIFSANGMPAGMQAPHPLPPREPTAPLPPAALLYEKKDGDAAARPFSCGFGQLTLEHIEVMRYYLVRIRYWMDQETLDGTVGHFFDEKPPAGVTVAAVGEKAAAVQSPAQSSPVGVSSPGGAAVSYTMSEVKAHADVEGNHRAWTVIQGKVYDITTFYKSHPGGSVIMMQQAFGQDCTEAFNEVEHSDTAVRSLEKYFIGNLSPEAAN